MQSLYYKFLSRRDLRPVPYEVMREARPKWDGVVIVPARRNRKAGEPSGCGESCSYKFVTRMTEIQISRKVGKSRWRQRRKEMLFVGASSSCLREMVHTMYLSVFSSGVKLHPTSCT